MRAIHFLCFVLIGTIGCTPSEKSRLQHGARVSVNTVEHVGEPDSAGHVVHEFVIKNVGNATLALSEINSTCGCTVARVSKQEIEAGDQATIHVDFHSTPYRRESAVYVHTNDAIRRVLRFRIAATKLREGTRQLQFLPSVVHLKTEAGRSMNGRLLLQLTEWGVLQTSIDSICNANLTVEGSGIHLEFDREPTDLLKKVVTWKEQPVPSADKPVIQVVHSDRVVTVGQVRYSIDSDAFLTPGEHRRVLLAQVGPENNAARAIATLIVHVASTAP